MDPKENYIEINRESWNTRTGHHLKSDFYDLEGFLNGKTSLKPIELNLLGDVKGKSILHLQCHFGQDTLSLSRMGAHVTGIDFSDKAIESARKLNDQMGLDAEFVCCDIYELPAHLHKTFDIVFTSYGVIGWLPDMTKWAVIIDHFLKPGGKFAFVEFHPVLWMFDNDVKEVAYNYFNAEPIIETESGTYADRNAELTQQYVTWNHSLDEVIGALLKQKLSISDFKEYDYSPYNIFKDTEQAAEDKFRVKHMGNRIPLVYSILAEKKI